MGASVLINASWYYAIDGLAGIALTVISWHISARITRWWLAQTEPGAARETVVA